MWFSSLGREPFGRSIFSWQWPILCTWAFAARAINFDPVPSPGLDLSQLGRVGLVGDFDAISLYSYRQQSQNAFSTNGSQSILAPLPNGAFATLASADAYIEAMCPLVEGEGDALSGVVIVGNFTSLGGVEAQGVALFNASSNKVTPLPGVTGKIATALCDKETNRVFIGGEFRGANSTNAIAWIALTGWANLPFAGFNGPVNSITKAPNGNIIFGGRFDGLGNATGPAKKDQQIVNLSTANISAGGTTNTTSFSDPKNIICKTNGQDGPGNTWLLSDNSPGHFRAEFRFGFRPTKLRIWNTRQDGRGTKTFRFTALPINGIMNLTYTDPSTQDIASCDARCPLTNDPKVRFQDFSFVNVIGMSAFQLDISEWYGQGGGLNGIELFQDDIYAFAINDFNEPSCAGIQHPSSATVTGAWRVMPSSQSSSGYLSGVFSTERDNGARVVFTPDIKESGNYSVTIYTPGCIQDNTCLTRGRVNITGNMATSTPGVSPIQTEIFQTNNFDKYDQIYSGYVDAASGSFQPSVTLTPSANQSGSNVTVVAQRVRFELISSTGGLNGLYEYNPNDAVANTNFSRSAFDQAGIALDPEATITSLSTYDGITYVGGNFTAPDFQNVFSIKDNESTPLTGGGLNGQVITLLVNENLLYLGGNFSDTLTTHTEGLSNLAAYSIPEKTWQPLGAGVNGRVDEIVPLPLNISGNTPEDVISFTGHFSQILPFDGQQAIMVQGFAIWVPSRKNWLQNLDVDVPSLSGQLTTSADLRGAAPLYAGSLSSQGLSANGAVTIPVSGPLSINRVPLKILPRNSQTRRQKRAVSGQNVTGVVTGFFYESGNRNVTILGGHFTARGSNGSNIENLAFINGSRSNEVTGLGPGLSPDSAFLALGVQQDILYAGGTISGTANGDNVNGLILFDLVAATYVKPQPPPLEGPEVAVNAIATRPGTGDVYVGGNFDSAGSLPCPSICIFTTSASQWNRPGDGIGGSVGAMAWAGGNKLVVGGNLTINGTGTSMATYDGKNRQWSSYSGARDVPGPVTALSAADDEASRYWIAGASPNGSAFLMNYDGKTFRSVGDTLGKTTRIRGLQVLSLSRNHERSDLLDQDKILLVTGQLDLPNFGNASAALFNGTTFTPFILSTSANNSPGSISQFVSQKQNFFKGNGGHLAVGYVVLISLAIALALTFLLVVLGIIAERIRRKREGYLPAPTFMYERNENVDRIPPQHLLSTMGRGRPGSTPML